MMLGWIMVFANTFLILMFMLRIACNFIPMIFILFKLIITAIIKKLRKKEKVGVAEIIDGKKEKDEDQAAFQQLLDILNFLR